MTNVYWSGADLAQRVLRIATVTSLCNSIVGPWCIRHEIWQVNFHRRDNFGQIQSTITVVEFKNSFHVTGNISVVEIPASVSAFCRCIWNKQEPNAKYYENDYWFCNRLFFGSLKEMTIQRKAKVLCSISGFKVNEQNCFICIPFSTEFDLSPSAQVSHVLTRITQCLPTTHTFIHKWNEPHLPLLPAAEHHRTLAGTHFRPADGRRLSWPG